MIFEIYIKQSKSKAIKEEYGTKFWITTIEKQRVQRGPKTKHKEG
jgi:hypothetical protein